MAAQTRRAYCININSQPINWICNLLCIFAFPFQCFTFVCVCVCFRWWSSKVRCFTSQNPTPSCFWARRVLIGWRSSWGGAYICLTSLFMMPHVMSFWWVCQSLDFQWVYCKQNRVWQMNCYLLEQL